MNDSLAVTAGIVSCNLPPSTGSEQPVVASTGSQVSASVDYVSYAPPSVSQVLGCQPDPNGDLTSTVECDRLGGTNITLIGDNLCVSLALACCRVRSGVRGNA